jgi:hypothetical protein
MGKSGVKISLKTNYICLYNLFCFAILDIDITLYFWGSLCPRNTTDSIDDNYIIILA